ncbi:MAG: rod shape-determining protein RodA [Bacteroidaceae bacterium]|nr:rod shape-determining protein RodA [Bacteroidaceae bacterium]
MVTKRVNILSNIDWLTVALYIIVMICGWLSICGAASDVDATQLLSMSTRPGKQLLWMVCALGLASFIMLITKDFVEKYSYLIYALSILLLIVTIFIAEDTKGSRSWIDFGGFKIQPAEFTKFTTALALARFVDTNKLDLSKWSSLLKSAVLIMVPLLLIICQKETGTAIVFLAFFLVLYREGMTGNLLLIGFCMVLFFILGIKYSDVTFANQVFSVGVWLVLSMVQIITTILVWMYSKERRITAITFYINICGMVLGMSVSMLIYPFDVTILQIILISVVILLLIFRGLMDMARQYFFIALFAICSVGYLYSVDYVFEKVLEPHQQVRINVILGLEDDPYGAGYNVNQSKIAIGSGGFSGKGFMKGTQTKLKYVPEQDTDFIFCTVGEEQGFLGSAFVLILYLGLLLRLVHLAELQTSQYCRIYGYSVACILFFHVFVNIGMVLGITPVIGIPLPFFSYGGSSLWGFTILLFLFLRMDSERTAR